MNRDDVLKRIKELRPPEDELCTESYGEVYTTGLCVRDIQQLAADHELLTKTLQNCIDAIEILPRDVFGVGGDGQTHWYVRDELIGRAKETLQGAK